MFAEFRRDPGTIYMLLMKTAVISVGKQGAKRTRIAYIRRALALYRQTPVRLSAKLFVLEVNLPVDLMEPQT
jgi:hypothetical protein